VWDLTTGEGIGDTLRSGDVSSIAVTSVKGVTIAVATTESTVRAWSLGLS
jgi:WD40 repeat protein